MAIERCACDEAEHYRKAMILAAGMLDFMPSAGAVRSAAVLRAALRDVTPDADATAAPMVDQGAL